MYKLKGVLVFFLSVFSLASGAQDGGGMSQERMQQMMQGMSGMASCFQNLDQNELQAMADRGKAKHEELKQLCASGKRDEAQREAMAFAMEYMNSDVMKQLQTCGEMAQARMPKMPDYAAYADASGDGAGARHVCDDI